MSGYIGKMPKCGCIVGAFALCQSKTQNSRWAAEMIKHGLILEYVKDVSQVQLRTCPHFSSGTTADIFQAGDEMMKLFFLKSRRL